MNEKDNTHRVPGFNRSSGVAGIIEAAINSRDAPKDDSYKFMMTPVGDLETISRVQGILRDAGFDFRMAGGIYPEFKTEKELIKAMLHLYGPSGGSYIADRFIYDLKSKGLIDEKGKRLDDKIKEYLTKGD